MSHNEYPLLPLRSGVLLPGVVMTVSVGRKRSVAMLESLPKEGEGPRIAVAVQRDGRIRDPALADLHPIGTIAQVMRVAQASRGTWQVTLRGERRFAIESLSQTPFCTVDAAPVDDASGDAAETRARADALANVLRELDPDGAGSLAPAVAAYETSGDPGQLADQVAATVELTQEQRVHVLLTLDVSARLETVTRLAGETLASAEARARIENSVRGAFSKQQRDQVLRQQLAAIRRELGDEDDTKDRLRGRIEAKDLPEEVRAAADRELRRLEAMPDASAEANVVRSYLDWIAELPWNERAEVHDDLDAVAAKLDADHFGLDEVKKRILEHLAVLKLSGNPRGTILCLAGPPGTGKTSLARSIADATGRPFVRIALGGVRDEAEIRGHRRTYVGALPGRIVAGLRKAGARNPVMLLDEIDKLAVGFGGGSPESALLEVLDPEQNKLFTDHYLEQAFDLSEVVFVCTANVLANLSAPLRDRLEVVQIEGYTPQEKARIARAHLIPKQLDAHGIDAETLVISDEVLGKVVADYTREAGVRQLERELVRLCRASALQVARGGEARLEPTLDDLRDLLGKPRFDDPIAERASQVGVATGLAWTPVGGDILFIETSRMPGKGKLEITGQLGDVMNESARAAMTYVRSHAEDLGIDPAFLSAQDVHIHVPAGAIPKDGPSAGVTMFTALTSLLTGRQVRPNVAMTGEATLRGRVLPVGGIKAKVLAAHRAGLEHVVLPKRNERDLDDVPDVVREALDFTFAEDMRDVLEVALLPDGTATPTLHEALAGDDAYGSETMR